MLRASPLLAGISLTVRAEELDAATQTKVAAKIEQIKTWAAEATLVKAVKAQNENLPAGLAGMTQDKWKAAGILDPVVRSFTKNEAATVLKSKKTEAVSEAFLSAADGGKVAVFHWRRPNDKITTAEDLELVEHLLSVRNRQNG